MPIFKKKGSQIELAFAVTEFIKEARFRETASILLPPRTPKPIVDKFIRAQLYIIIISTINFFPTKFQTLSYLIKLIYNNFFSTKFKSFDNFRKFFDEDFESFEKMRQFGEKTGNGMLYGISKWVFDEPKGNIDLFGQMKIVPLLLDVFDQANRMFKDIKNNFNIVEDPIQDFCSICFNYDSDLGVCYEIKENVRKYPDKFKYCNGKLFKNKHNIIEGKLNNKPAKDTPDDFDILANDKINKLINEVFDNDKINKLINEVFDNDKNLINIDKSKRNESGNSYLVYPEWFQLLDNDIKPNKNNINKLEGVRKELKIPHTEFAQFICGSPLNTYKTQYYVLNDLKIKFPNYDERRLWRMVLESRSLSAETAGFNPLPEEDIQELIKNALSFDDLVRYIVSKEFERPMPHMLRKIYSKIVEAAGENNLTLKPVSLLLHVKDFIVDFLMILKRNQ